jgi:putative tricarboxylic transport membrane protein
VIGVYSNQTSLLDVNSMIFFGVVGYLARKTGFECAPLVFAYILSPIWEEAFRQSLLMSQGDLTIFVTRPFPAVFIVLTGLFVASSVIFARRRSRLLEQIGSADD